MPSVPLPFSAPHDPALQSVLRHVTRALEHSGVDSPRLCAELLAAHALKLSRQDLLKTVILEPERALAERMIREIEVLAERRASGEPAAYILGMKEFHGRDFQVSPAVLIPRPETELLIDTALTLAKEKEENTHPAPASPETAPRFADFGTGSGCIAVTLALELPSWRGLALDDSPKALDIARANALRLGASNLTFALADFSRPPLAASSLDLLASNPPYVSEAEYRQISREVRGFEPKSALVPHSEHMKEECREAPGASGLEAITTVIAQAEVLLRPGGYLLMEIGCDQAEATLAALTPKCWTLPRVLPDLAGLSRLLVAKMTNYT